METSTRNIHQEKIKEMAEQKFQEWEKTADPDTLFGVTLALAHFDKTYTEMEKNGIPEYIDIFKIIAAKRYGIDEKNNVSQIMCEFAIGFYEGLTVGANLREEQLKEIAERNADVC